MSQKNSSPVKKKKKKRGNVSASKKTKNQCYCPRKKSNQTKLMCTCTWAFLSIKKKMHFHSIFFPFWWGPEHFGGPREKTPGPHHLFFFLPTQPNIFQKKFHSHFLSKVFHSPCFTSKQTHSKATTLLTTRKKTFTTSNITITKIIRVIYILLHL